MDPINLIEVLDGYALACEFSIEGRCDIQGIVNHISIKPVVKPLPLGIELSRVHQYIVDIIGNSVYSAYAEL
jgi:hypothetical protein